MVSTGRKFPFRPTDGVVATEDEVLAVGSGNRSGVMWWSSTDEGGTWAIVERDGIPPVHPEPHRPAG